MHDPAQQATPKDKRLGKDIGPPGPRDKETVMPKVAPGEKVDPASAEVPPRGGSSNPERVAIGQGCNGKDRTNGIADQGRVEVAQTTRTEENEHKQHYHH